MHELRSQSILSGHWTDELRRLCNWPIWQCSREIKLYEVLYWDVPGYFWSNELLSLLWRVLLELDWSQHVREVRAWLFRRRRHVWVHGLQRGDLLDRWSKRLHCLCRWVLPTKCCQVGLRRVQRGHLQLGHVDRGGNRVL